MTINTESSLTYSTLNFFFAVFYIIFFFD